MTDFNVVSVILAGLIAYLIGSIPFGYLIAKARGVNLHQVGSKNIGATNTGRALGQKWFYVVFILDFAKGAFPVVMAYLFRDLAAQREFGDIIIGDVMVAAAVGASLGHVFPIYLKFRGGKAVATGLGVITGLLPLAGLICFSIFLIVLFLSRYMAVASISGGLAGPLVYLLNYPSEVTDAPYLGRFIVIIALALLILVRHQSNIRRIIEGKESRMFGRKDLEKRQKAQA